MRERHRVQLRQLPGDDRHVEGARGEEGEEGPGDFHYLDAFLRQLRQLPTASSTAARGWCTSRRAAAAEAAEIVGPFLGMITQLDNPTSSARTREILGWKPEHPGLLADIAEGHYFASPVPA